MPKITPKNTLKAQYEFSTEPPNKTKHVGMVGGFRSGKTRAIPLRWINLIDWRAKKQKARTKIMIVEPTKEMIRDILVPEMDDFCNTFNIPHHYHKTFHDYTVWFKGHKFTALLRSSEIPESLTGKTLTDIIIDEFDKKHPVSKQKVVWRECISRVSKAPHGTVSAVTTPEGYKLTYDLWGDCDYKEVKNFKLIRAATDDNHFLPPDFIENLYNQFSKELVDQYIKGLFINLIQGKVYYAFSREKNLTNDEYDKRLTKKLICDFNVNPMKWGLVQTWKDENDLLVDEFVRFNTYTEEVAKMVGEKYGYDEYYEIYGDYSGSYGSTKSQTSDYEIIKAVLPNSDLYIKPKISQIDNVNALNCRFRNSKGEVRFRINKNCTHAIKDFEQVQWKEKKREIDKDSNHELTHISDAMSDYAEYNYSLRHRIIGHQYGEDYV